VKDSRSPALEETEDGVEYRYYRCPLKFIPKNVVRFARLRRYVRDFPGTMPPIKEVSGRFINAYQYYDAKLAEYSREVNNGR